MDPFSGNLRPGGAFAPKKGRQTFDLEDDPYDMLEKREYEGSQSLSLFEQIVRQCGDNVFQMHVRGKDGQFVPVPFKQVFDDEERDYLESHGAEFGAPEDEPVFPHRPQFRAAVESFAPIGETFEVPLPLLPVVPVAEDHVAKNAPEFFQVGGSEVGITDAELALQVPDLVGTSSVVAVNVVESGGVKCEFSNGAVSLKVDATFQAVPTEPMFAALTMIEKLGVDFTPLRKQFDEIILAAVFARYEITVEAGLLIAKIRSQGSDDDPLWKVACGPLALLVSQVVARAVGRKVIVSTAWTLANCLKKVEISVRDLRSCVEGANALSRCAELRLIRIHVPEPSEIVRHSARVLGSFLSVLPRVRRRSVAYIPRSARDFESVLVLCAAYGIPVERRSSPDCSRPIICGVRGSHVPGVDRLGIIAFSQLLSLEVIDGAFSKRFMPLYRYVRPREVQLGQYVRLHYTRTRLVVTCMCTIQRAVDGVERVVMSPERRSPDRYAPYVRIVCAYLSGNAPPPIQWSYYAYYRGPDPRLELYPLLIAHSEDFVSSVGVDAEPAPDAGPPIATFVACDLSGRRPVPIPAVVALAHV